MRKNNKFVLAAMVIAASLLAASCQKENETEENTGKAVSQFNPANLQIDDMNAYLEGFKEKMENAGTKGSTETMAIDEAAWLLSSLANYQFANANAPHNNLRFDKLYFNVDITDGVITMNDLNEVYGRMAYAIKDFKKNINCENPNFRFIFVTVAKNGAVTVELQTSFMDVSKYWGDVLWHYDNNFDCYDYFSPNTNYSADSLGRDALVWALNLTATYEAENPNPFAIFYYTYTVIDTFYFEDYIDPYGSHFVNDSRLYATSLSFHYNIPIDDMCYLLDSYAGLAWDNTPTMKYPISYGIKFQHGANATPSSNKLPQIGNHKLGVVYGIPHEIFW